MNEDPKILMEEGWKAREDLEFEKAERLLNQALKIFEESEDWFNVTESLNHLAYTEKLKAVHHNLRGMEYAEESRGVAETHSTKKIMVLRALMSLADSAGLFELALKYGHECLSEISKPLHKADVLCHIATFQLRTGQLAEAEETIKEAELLMEQHINEEKEPHLSIWKSKILATKGLILYNKGDKEEAKRFLSEALDIAKKQNLKTRVAQIDAILGLF
jgi:tetratricopeptide (TPR) repeat protein